MASYLSYFTSNSSSAPPQQQSSYAQPANSTWTSTFSSRIATLRKAITKDSEEDDPDNEDCSHVSNVLRAYYTQKGRQLPPWLPPDPKRPQPVPQVPAQPQYGQYGNAYGNPYGQETHSRNSSLSGAGAGAGGLSDLWDPAPTQRPAPQSLRAPRPTPQSMRSSENDSRQRQYDNYSSSNTQQTLNPRPLPSQRAGSFQTTAAANTPTATAAANPKNERLRARLQGGGSGRNSPATSQSSQNPYGDSGYSGGQAGGAPYTSATQPWSSGGGYDNYTSGEGYGGYSQPSYRQRPAGQR